MATISYPEAFKIIRKRDVNGKKVPFSIRFTTHDEKRHRKGSRHIEWPKAEECGANHDLQAHGQIGVRPLGKNAEASQTSVHIRLIEKINGHTVL